MYKNMVKPFNKFMYFIIRNKFIGLNFIIDPVLFKKFF